jgi:hypothetical protein
VQDSGLFIILLQLPLSRILIQVITPIPSSLHSVHYSLNLTSFHQDSSSFTHLQQSPTKPNKAQQTLISSNSSNMQFNLLTLALLAATTTALPVVSSTPAKESEISTISDSDSDIPKFYSSIPEPEDISKIMLLHDPTIAARTDNGKLYEGKHEGPGTPYDDGKWHEGKYEGPGTGYNNGQYHPHPGRDPQVKQDDGKWYERKYEGPNTPYNNGKYPAKQQKRDDGKWHEGKYEGSGTEYNNAQWIPHSRRDAQVKQDDGKWYEGKYEGSNTPYDNGQYHPHPGRYAELKQDDGKWHEGKYEGPNTPYNNGQYHG